MPGRSFWTSVALVEGRYPLPRAKVVTSDFSATPNPLIAHKTKNLLFPFSNIRAISRKLCVGFDLVIVDHRACNPAVAPRASGSFNPASMRSHARQRARLKPARRPHRALQIQHGERGRFTMSPLPLRADFNAQTTRSAARRSKTGRRRGDFWLWPRSTTVRRGRKQPGSAEWVCKLFATG